MTDARRDHLIKTLRSGCGPSDARCVVAARELTGGDYAPEDDAEKGVFAYARFIREAADLRYTLESVLEAEYDVTINHLRDMTDADRAAFETLLRRLLTDRH